MSDANNLLKPISGGTPEPQNNPRNPSAPPANAGGMAPLQSPAATTPPPRPPAPPGSTPPPMIHTPLASAAQPAPVAPGSALTFDEEEKAGFNRPLIIAVFGVGIISALVALLFFFRTPGAAVVPSEFDDFTSADNTFALKAPRGWNKRASGEAAGDNAGTRQNGVYMNSGGAHMEVTFSTVKGLVGAQLLDGKDITPEAMTGSCANGVDKMQKPAVKNKFQGYSEKKVEEVPSGMGGVIADMDKKAFKPDAVMYEFSAKSDSWGMGGPVRGYRAVLAGQDLIAAVVCYAPEKEWGKLQPTFLKFIESVHELRAKSSEGDQTDGSVPGGGSLPDTNSPVGIPSGLTPGGGGQ